ncbi:MAG: hypothetical protein U0074_05220 [Kouleothrix sp.]
MATSWEFTVNGAVLCDPGYTADPLVFCGTVELAPRDATRTTHGPATRLLC